METKEIFEQLIQSLRESGDTVTSSILLEDVKTGDDIPKSHLNKIGKYTRTSPDPESLYTFPVLMIDTAPTRNKVIYTEASQKKSVKSWPGTTYLFNSNGASDLFSGADHRLASASQIGRIYDAQVVRTPKGLVGTLGWVYTVKGTESTDDFVHKVDAGILKEVSIHVSVPGGVQCSICEDVFGNCIENSKTKKDPKGTYHYPGEQYNGKTCYMTTHEAAFVPVELSNVACPGSVNAHIMQDDEVQNYQVVSLREALGGSREALNLIQQENEMNSDQARVKLRELAEAAGVTIKEAVADDKNKTIVERADVDTWSEMKTAMPAAKKGDGDGDGDDNPKGAKGDGKNGKKMDPPEDNKQNANPDVKTETKKPIALFEGNCPVCLRTGSSSESADEDAKKMREEFQAIVTTAAEKSREIIADLTEKLEKAENLGNFGDLFADYVSETVDLAVERGMKTVEEKNAYRETLVNLPYAAVKEIRESFKHIGTASPRAEAKKRVEESMSDRFKREGMTTQVEADQSGAKVSRIGRRPKLALK
ncbi:MAG: hypothetical protein NVSMB14_01030 [Isosphaeraceae bacterium]